MYVSFFFLFCLWSIEGPLVLFYIYRYDFQNYPAPFLLLQPFIYSSVTLKHSKLLRTALSQRTSQFPFAPMLILNEVMASWLNLELLFCSFLTSPYLALLLSQMALPLRHHKSLTVPVSMTTYMPSFPKFCPISLSKSWFLSLGEAFMPQGFPDCLFACLYAFKHPEIMMMTASFITSLYAPDTV